MNERVERANAICISFTRRIAFGGVLAMLIVAGVTIVDIFFRVVFNSPISAMNEIVAMVFAIAITACFPAGIAQRVHLRVNILSNYFGEKLSSWLTAIGSLLLFWMFALFTWRIGVYATEMYLRDATTMILNIPRSPFLWAVTFLCGISAIVQYVVFAGDVFTARSKSPGIYRGITTLCLLGGLLTTLVAILIFDGAVAALSTPAKASPVMTALVIFGLVWVLLFLLIPIGAVMVLLGFIGMSLLLDPSPALSVVGSEVAEFLTNGQLVVLPLFLMMGVLASAAGLSEDIYRLAQALLGNLRGGLALATIGGCAGFGAVTGSSVATATTIGRVALPEMSQRGYEVGFSAGCVAAGGTLGALVPPSSALILYAFLTEESIGQLFVAALVPAALGVLLYMLTISAYVRLVPNAAPAPGKIDTTELMSELRRGLTVIVLFAVVMGGIYIGLFTATEAASVGVIGAFLVALFRGKLRGGAFWNVMGETASITAMIYVLILGGITISFFLGITELPEFLTKKVAQMDLAPLGIITLLLVVYILLGAVMESFSIMVITVPVIAGLIVDLGFDLTWWGVIMLVVVEIGLITPPFGINVFVLKAVAGADLPLTAVFRGVMPFVGADIVKLILLVLLPSLVLWLPSTMFN